MGAAKEMWIAEVEAIETAYYEFEIGRTEAMKDLMAKGFDEHEADNMLEAIDGEHVREEREDMYR